MIEAAPPHCPAGAPLAAPAEHPLAAPAEQRAGSVIRRELPDRVVRGLERGDGAATGSGRHTLAACLVAGWAASLGRSGGVEDVQLGLLVAETLLPLRIGLAGRLSWRDLVAAVEEAMQAAGAGGSGAAAAALAAWGPGSGFSLTHTGTGAAGTLRVAAGPMGAVSLALELAPGELPAAARLLDHFVNLAAAAAGSPAAPVAALPWLGEAERHQLTVEWNDSASAFPRGALVHELFEEWAARTPSAPAVGHGGEEHCYGEVNERAERLAAQLRRLGLRPEQRVAVAMERSLGLIVALLAVLKAGGAYAPLDGDWPAERLDWVLGDLASGSATWVLADEAWRARLSAPAEPAAAPGEGPAGEAPAKRARIVPLGRDGRLETASTADGAPADGPPADGAAGWAGIARQGGERERSAAPESLAYVMYTSGTSGRPKGVAVPHRAVVRLVRETGYARFDAAEVILQLAPAAFDASTLEIWGALANGGKLVLFPGSKASLEEIGTEIEERQISTLWLTAGLFHQMVDWNPAGLGGVRQLLAGGDVLSAAHVRSALAACAGRTVINGYGPTENTTFTCCHPVRAGETVAEPVPLGRPIANTRAYVLDDEMAPQPIGVAGELYAAGDGLARGYLKRPDLTAERFVPDPAGGAGGRLYRTGDLARFLPGGQIEFLGRRDGQIKVRGHRIEPGEVEAALLAHPAVAQAVVAAWPPGRAADVAAERRLVAYLVPRSGAGGAPAAPPETLRAFLRGRLPEPLVPSSYVWLPALPLTANGKVDRRALPPPAGEVGEPAGAAAGGGKAPAMPAMPATIEAAVAAIFAEVLRRPAVGVDDDFFDLGGHSLLATQVLSRLRRSLGIRLPLRAIFAAPSAARLAAAITRQRPELEASARAADEPAAAAAAAGPAGRARAAALPELPPLSFGQRSLWFLDRLAPGSAFYNVPVALRLCGPLSRPVLAGALAEIVRRHEALRTTFRVVNGEPVQRIHPAAPPRLPVADLGALPAALREVERDRCLEDAGARPFDLMRGPLMRPLLLALDAERHVLLLALHHIVVDGWSVRVIHRELAEIYGAFAAGKASPLAELPRQFAEYAAGQRRRIEAGGLAGEVAYWRERLAGAPEALELPTDHPRPPEQSFRGDMVRMAVPAGLAARLRGERRATLFMQLLAAWAALLSRWSGQEQVLVGTPVANRGDEQLEGLIGYFVNTLVMRLDLGGAPSWLTLLAQAREAALAGFNHQELPFELLVESLHPRRDLSRGPLVQNLLVVQNAPHQAAGGDAGLRFLPLDVAARGAKFDLMLAAEEGRGEDSAAGLGLSLEYATDLFTRPTALRLLAQLAALLESATAAPERPVAELELLAPAERAQLQWEWNDTGATAAPAGDETAGGECLHELFAAQAARQPAATALVAAEGSLSYGDLAWRAAAVAARLRRLGVGPEVRVAVLLERSPDLVAALLGVLAAGGAYVPIDPRYPAARIDLLIADSAAAVVISRRSLLESSGASCGKARTVLMAADWWEEGGPGRRGVPALVERAAAAPRAAAGNLAYLIYTSGSTGEPKAVAIEHRSAVALARWARLEFSAAELSGVLAATAVTFDLSVFELFVPLAWGGTVVLAEDALALPRLAAAGRVTLVNTVPSALAELVRDGALPAGVVTVNLAGEALPGALARRIYESGGVQRVLNLYGPSEDTTYSTGAVVGRQEASPPIGRPIRGTRAYVLDRAGELAPRGVPGELYLGGEGLARGYLGRPALTAERFVPDPFGAPPGSCGAPAPAVPAGAESGGRRLYRTGDLVRRRWNGEMEFLGRIDHQVKVRGFRIELGEVEAALAALPELMESAVLAHGEAAAGDGSGSGAGAGSGGQAPAAAGLTHLAAYLVPVPGGEVPTPAALRAALHRRLPEHMVPSRFVALAALPRTSHGKIDRRALRELAAAVAAGGGPGRGNAAAAGRAGGGIGGIGSDGSGGGEGAGASEAQEEAPRTRAEELVAGVWAEAFGIERVGLHDNFFDLGGHSLLASRVASRLCDALAIDLPVRRVFEAPTVASLAALVERAGAARRQLSLEEEPARRGAAGRGIAASFFQRRLWFLDQLAPGMANYNMSLSFRIAAPLDVPALQRAVREIVRRHEVLRTTFEEEPEGGGILQVVQPPPEPALPRVDLAALPAGTAAGETRRLVDAVSSRAFDLAAGPLLQGALLELGPAEHVLALTVHHIAFDAFSGHIFERELQALYAAFAAGLPSPLPALPMQYADYAAWQERSLSGGALAGELEDWVRELRGAPQVLDLPTDLPRPPVQSFRGGSVQSTLSAAVVGGLRRRREVTPFMQMLTGFAVLLARYSGQRDLLVGAAASNRQRAETEPLIGFFINTLPMRVDLRGQPSWRQLTGRVREAALATFAHQELPFDLLIEKLSPERDLSRNPLVQVMLTFHQAATRGAASGLPLEAVAARIDGAKFDLTMEVVVDAASGAAEVGVAKRPPGGASLELEYAADLFTAATARRMTEHLVNLLAAAAADPERSIEELPLLAAAERHQVLREWNDVAAGGLRLHVLDGFGEPAPVGVAGEIALGGAGVEHGDGGGGEQREGGERGQPEVAAARCVPDPWAGEAGARLHLTGDRGRRLPDGRVRRLGRLDAAIRVRGIAAEPEELADALCRHPGVRQALVTAAGSAPGQRLVAYVVLDSPPPSSAELRDFLGHALPAPLVPECFVPIAAIPLRHDGEPDWAALPPPPPPRAEKAGGRSAAGSSNVSGMAGIAGTSGAPDAAPEGQVQELLHRLWSELLGRPPANLDDNFFDLGGTSLLGARLASRLRSHGIDVPVRHLFEAPTIAGLAALIGRLAPMAPVPPMPPMAPAAPTAGAGAGPRAGTRAGAAQRVEGTEGSAALPPIVAQERPADLPLSLGQQRLWFVDRLHPGEAVLNLPTPMRLSGRLEVAALAAALGETVRRHEILRTVIRRRGGEPWQMVLPAPAGGAARLPVVDLGGLPAGRRGGAAERLAEEESRRPFAIERDVLLRLALVRLAADEHLLLCAMHHLVADGWSVDVLMRELAALYEAAAARRPSTLPELALQYADFAIWQRLWLRGPVLDRLLEEWRGHFGELFGKQAEPLRLPVDRPRPAVPSAAGELAARALAPGFAAGARQLARAAGGTLFMALLAGFDALLHRLAGQDVVVVGTPIAGRHHAEIEPLIGFFVNTLVLPVDCAGDPSFRQLLERVREAALTAYGLQDLPFEKLVEALQPERRGVEASPLFRVMFVLQSEGRPAPPGAALQWEPVHAAIGTAQFDLTFFINAGPEVMTAALEYRADLFTAATAELLLAAYEQLVAAAIAGPDTPLSRLPLPADLARLMDGIAAAPAAGAAPAVPESGAGAPRERAGTRQERLASRQARLSPEQREALERRRRGGGSGGPISRPGGAAVLVELTPAPAPGEPGAAGRPPLFCVHPAGGDVVCFVPLARHLGADQPCWGVQSRGLAPEETPLATIEEMAALYVAEVRRVQPAGPYLLAGWSFGGFAAFEMARQLEALGERVALLAVLDAGPALAGAPGAAGEAPGGGEPGPSSAHGELTAAAPAAVPLAELLLEMERYARGLWGKDLRLGAADLAGLGEEEQLRLFVERARLAGLVHHADSLEQVRRVVAVFRANVLAFRRYRPRRFGGGVTLMRAAAAAQGGAGEAAPDLGWGRVSGAPPVVHEVPGDHVTLLAEPNVRLLAELLRTVVDGALAPV